MHKNLIAERRVVKKLRLVRETLSGLEMVSAARSDGLTDVTICVESHTCSCTVSEITCGFNATRCLCGPGGTVPI